MRILFIVSLTFVSSLALAYPKQNDKVEFLGATVLKNGTKKSVSSKLEVVEYDSLKKEFQVRQETVVDAQASVSTEFTREENMLTRESVQDMLASCQKMGGRSTMLTVPAGSFNSCAMPSEDEESSGTIWIADVPSGAIQADVISKADGSRAVMKLKSVTFGQ